MKLSHLLKDMIDTQMVNDLSITNITLDSRAVMPDGLFLSLAKSPEQRLQYLQQALTLQAVAVVYDSEQPLTDEEVQACQQHDVVFYPIANLSQRAGEIAARFYDHPSQKLTVIAITGTNGKTSVSQFIAQAFESMNIPCGVIGTLGVGRVTQLLSTGMTTPDPVTLQSVLAEFESQSIQYVVVEASSHALEQGRLNSVDIDTAVLTNLSRDHLDFHNSMDSYAAAKQRLFEFASIKHAVINIADDFGKTLLQNVDHSEVQVFTYSTQAPAQQHYDLHVQAVAINTKPEGISFKLQSKDTQAEINSPLVGRFNVDNLLAATLALLASGIEFENALEAITHCRAVDGRMEVYGGESQVQVVIDFAHTPDALIQALSSLRSHLSSQGQLWCVFGCGGDRDKGKRALMGKAVETNADKLVITADNPRSESNEAIVKDILAGIKSLENVYIEHDRQQAINYAINSAKVDDIVLVAGKGHEQYQEISGVKHNFSDAQAVTKALAAANDANHSSVRAKS